jgi:hypothetical protein
LIVRVMRMLTGSSPGGGKERKKIGPRCYR